MMKNRLMAVAAVVVLALGLGVGAYYAQKRQDAELTPMSYEETEDSVYREIYEEILMNPTYGDALAGFLTELTDEDLSLLTGKVNLARAAATRELDEAHANNADGVTCGKLGAECGKWGVMSGRIGSEIARRLAEETEQDALDNEFADGTDSEDIMPAATDTYRDPDGVKYTLVVRYVPKETLKKEILKKQAPGKDSWWNIFH